MRSREIFDKDELKPSSAKRDGYFQTLLHQHNQYMPLGREEREEMIRENEINYVQAYQGPSGPLKYMSEEAKEKVHQELDLRMQEVEDTGLTRSEILHEKQTGVKLADDPFFQFIKSSRTAREMLLKPGEEFTADRVIELALRQDVSPDDSLSMNKEDYRVRDWDSGEQPNWEYKKKYRDMTPLVEPDAYFAGNNVVERRKKLFEYDQERPATFINRPLSRQQLRRKLMRPIRKKDIDYFNTPMMTKFLNDTGKLYNRYQTRLETSVQRRVAKTIKKMRAQFVLPTVGLIKPTDKIALGSYIEEVEEMHKKTIDPVTGRLFMKHSLQDDLVVKLEREKERFEKRFGHIETMDNEEFTRAKEEADAEYKLIREMSIDNDQILPDARTRHWMVAQSHLMFEQGKDRIRQQESEIYNEAREAIREELSDEEELKQFEASEEWSLPGDLERHRAKKAYDDITRRLRTKDLNSDNLFEDLISEKAYELERFAGKTADAEAAETADPAQDLLAFAHAGAGEPGEPSDAPADQVGADDDDLAVKRQIQEIMQEYAAPRAKGGLSYNAHEDPGTPADGQGFQTPLEEPDVRVQK